MPREPAYHREQSLWRDEREEHPGTVVDGATDTLLDLLRAGGAEREEACATLRELLVRAALATLHRQGYPPDAFGADDYEAAAEEFAQEALVIILRQLDSFRGACRFTTWAYRIVINLVADEARRRAWRHQRLTDQPEDVSRWPAAPHSRPEAIAEQRAVWEAVTQCIQQDLTPLQRRVLVGRLVEDKPLIVLADELATSKDAIYKVLHDARRHLKRSLLARGLSTAEALAAFAQEQPS